MKKVVIAALILSLVGVSGVFAQSKGTDAKADTKTAAPAKTDAKTDAKAADTKAPAPAKDAKADTKADTKAAAPAKTDAKADTKAVAPAKTDAPSAAKPAGKTLYTDAKTKYEVIGDDKGNVYIYDKGAVAAKIDFVKVDGKSISIAYNKTEVKVSNAADVTAQLNGAFGLKAYGGGAKAIYDFWAAPKK